MIKQFIIEYDTDTGEWNLPIPDIGEDDPVFSELWEVLLGGFDMLDKVDDEYDY